MVALDRVWSLKPQIFAVADTLCERRVLGQDQIDAVLIGSV